MGMIEELGTFVDANSTRFALGTSLFLNLLPDGSTVAPTAAAIIETGGQPAVHTIGGSTRPAWEVARVQVLCRSTSSAIARANADAAWTLLEGVQNQALSGSTYLRVETLQPPFLAWRDDLTRPVFAFNAECWRRR